MPAYTPFLTLYKPGGGSTGLIVPDEVVDIDRLNANSDLIDAFAAGWGHAAERNHNLYGPAASLSAVTGMKRGDTYQESDGSFLEWRFDGSNWVNNANGMLLLRAASVATSGGGTATQVGGRVNFDTCSGVSLNGVFSSQYDEYVIEARITTQTVAGGGWIQLRAGGVDTTTGYESQTIYNNTATSITTIYSNTATGIPWISSAVAYGAKVTSKVTEPAQTARRVFVENESYGQNSGAIVSSRIAGSRLPGISFDGFSLVTSAGLISGFLRVYALAP